MKKLNLMTGGIQHSNLFLHMPLFDDIYYDGFLEGKVRKYTAVHESQNCRMLVLNVIRKDEDVIWDALEDLIKRAVADAAVACRGVFIFDLLTMDIHKELKTFKASELTQVILNNTRILKPGETKLIKYSTAYGFLQMLSLQHWGKITLKTSVEVFKDKPDFLDLLIKQLIKNFTFSNDPGILLLNDLSQEPLFEAANALQQERLNKVIKDQIPQSIDFPPEVYIQDKKGVRELLSQSTI
jgi:hypothetical protein